jgi:hypothetical protein
MLFVRVRNFSTGITLSAFENSDVEAGFAPLIMALNIIPLFPPGMCYRLRPYKKPSICTYPRRNWWRRSMLGNSRWGKSLPWGSRLRLRLICRSVLYSRKVGQNIDYNKTLSRQLNQTVRAGLAPLDHPSVPLLPEVLPDPIRLGFHA